MEEQTEAMIIANAITSIVERLRTVVEEALKTLDRFMRSVAQNFLSFYDDVLLHSVSTPREYHLMKYAKKRRTRKKYRRMLNQRLFTSAMASTRIAPMEVTDE